MNDQIENLKERLVKAIALRESIVLGTAGEFVGALKQHGYLANDPAPWIESMDLDDHLFQLAHPSAKDYDDSTYAIEFLAFKAKLNDIINPK